MSAISDYTFHPRLMLRTPACDPGSYHRPFEAVLQDGYFRAAIFTASKSLFGVLEKKHFREDLLTEKEHISLEMYYNRMCYRPTPFGLFSTFALSAWDQKETGDRQDEAAPPEPDTRTHVRIDYEYSRLLAEKILRLKEGPDTKYSGNNSLYRVGKEYRYLRFMQTGQNTAREFLIDAVEFVPPVSDILSFCTELRTRQELLGFIMKEFEASPEESTLFLEQLIDRQLIFPEMSPNITGTDYLERVLGKYTADGPGEESQLLGRAKRIRQLGDRISRSRAGSLAGQLLEMDREIGACLGNGTEAHPRLYVNRETSGMLEGLSAGLASIVREGLSCIQKLLPATPAGSLAGFREAFKDKYDNRWIPLLTALDPEVGVGYESLEESCFKSSLLTNVDLNYACDLTQELHWTPAHVLLMDRWSAAGQTDGIPAITLDETDVAGLPEDSRLRLPPSLSAVFRPLGKGVFIEQAGGVTATALLGRFTPFSPQISAMVREVVENEEAANPGVIFAEIAHICDAHIVNVDRREFARSYEIPILTGSALPESHQIGLNDLWVSVVDNETMLWSKRLKKRIIPRLTSAFNYLNNDLPIFRFLCDLQYQGLRPNLSFDLERFFPGLRFYPRVTYKEAVLGLASWHMSADDLREVTGAGDPDRPAALIRLVQKMHWPRFVSINRDDHYLVADLEHPADLRFLGKVLKKEGPVVVREFPFLEEGTGAGSGAPAPVKQYITTLFHKQKVYDPVGPEFGAHPARNPVERKFLPGSKWSSFKIYCHPMRSNELLSQYIIPLAARWVSAGFLDQWFFIRYSDPAYHLRLRFNHDPAHAGLILKSLTKSLAPLLKIGLVHNFQAAVYERELERFDTGIIKELERCFCISSTLVTRFFENNGSLLETGYILYQMAYSTLDAILDVFECGAKERIILFRQLYHELMTEFTWSKSLYDQIKRKFREIRKVTDGLSPHQIIASCNLHSEFPRFIYTHAILARLTAGWSPVKRDKLVIDLMHLHLNRLFSDEPRKNELIVYYCLWRQYESAEGKRIKQSRHSLAAD